MKLANIDGRAVLVSEDGVHDVAAVSRGRFGPDPAAVLSRWAEFVDWQAGATADGHGPDDHAGADPMWGPPVPEPRQVFAIGLNYGGHAAEAGLDPPSDPPVFTKFPTCLAGPRDTVPLPAGGFVDWEVELVVVIGAECVATPEHRAWSRVAGVMVGQDLSERRVQLSGPAPQFSLGKSFPRFGPTGPHLVTVDELPDPDDLELGCSLNGEVLQRARTSDLIFPVPELIARLSAVCRLLPGDLIFTGTPAGVGGSRTPPRFLAPGDELVSWVEGIGELRNTMTDTDPTEDDHGTAPAHGHHARRT
jgi:2,4-didehydro-3-deoxy-L-rhamnonate hydrolase